MINPLVAGLLLGIAGSLHCLGMCGPIALALPVPKNAVWSRFATGRLLYNIGRVVSYALLGALFGLLGQMISMAGWQQGLSIGAGVVILLALFTPKRYLMKLTAVRGVGGLYLRFKRLWAKVFGNDSLSGMFTIGILNGFLPCGLVYVALVSAAAMGSVGGGLMFMVAFGAGTIPAMLATSMAGKIVTPGFRRKLRKVVPAAAFVLAVLFIVRGLGLGIPYVSPDLSKMENACPHCAEMAK